MEIIEKSLALEVHLPSFEITKEIDALKNFLLSHLQHASDQGLSPLKKSEKQDAGTVLIAGDDVEQLQNVAEQLKSAVEGFEFVELGTKIKEIYESFLNQVIEYFNEICQKIGALFEEKRAAALKELEEYVNLMDQLRIIKAVELRTEKIYYQNIEKIFGFVRDSRKEIEGMLQMLAKQEQTFDYEKLVECIVCLNQAKWMDQRVKGESGHMIAAIQEKLIAHAEELHEAAEHLELDLGHEENLDKVYKMVSHLNKMRPLEVIMPPLKKHRCEVNLQLQQMLRGTLTLIQKEFQLEKCNTKSQEEIIQNLKKLQACAQKLRENSFLKEENIENEAELNEKKHIVEKEIEESQKSLKELQEQIQSINNRMVELTNISANYKTHNAGWSLTNGPKKQATEYLKNNQYNTIEEIESACTTLLTNLKELETKQKAQQTNQQKWSDILKQYQKVKEEYAPLAHPKEFLKQHNYSESQIAGFIRNEKQIIEEISRHEREIAQHKSSLSEYSFGILDAPKARKSLDYLAKCKNIPFPVDTVTNEVDSKKTQILFKLEISNILDETEKYLKNYCIFVEQTMQSCLEFLTSADTGTEVMDIREKAEILSNRLHEVDNIAQKHPIIFKYFSEDLLKQWKGKLERTWKDFSEQLESAAQDPNPQPLRRKILIAKVLSYLDDFVKPEQKFHDLYSRYQTELYGKVIETKPVLEAIEANRYMAVASEMFHIQQRKDGDPRAEEVFKGIKGTLLYSLQSLSRSTYMKVLQFGENDVDVPSVVNLENQMQKMEEAKRHVFVYIEPGAQKDLERIENNIKTAIEIWINKFLDTIEIAIANNNFNEAEYRIKLVKRIKQILENYVDSIEEKKQEQNKNCIKTRVAGLQTQLQEVLAKTVKKYQDIKLAGARYNPYISHPPKELYEKLKEAQGEIYNAAWQKIEQDITQKVRESLDQARANNLQNSEAIFRVVESTLLSLPERTRTMLESELAQCRDDVKREAGDRKKEVETIINEGDITKINQVLGERTKENDTEQVREIHNHIDRLAREISCNMDKQRTNDDIQGEFDSLVKLFHIKKNCNKVPGVEKVYNTAHHSISSKFDRAQKYLISNLTTLNRSDTNTIAIMEKEFDFIIKCMELKTSPPTDVVVAELLPTNFNEKMKQLHIKISTYFTSCQQAYTELDMKNLPVVLDGMKIVSHDSKFLEKVRAYMNRYLVEDALENTLAGIFTYEEMTRGLTSQFDQRTSEIMNQPIVNTKIKNNLAQLNRFYEELKGKLEIIKQLSALKKHIEDADRYEKISLKIEKDSQDVVTKITKLTETPQWSQSDYHNLNLWYSCFEAMGKHAILSNTDSKSHIDKVEDAVLKKVTNLEQEAAKNLEPVNVVTNVVVMKKMANNIMHASKIIDKRIDELLSAYKRHHKEGSSVSKLGVLLEKDETGIGPQIVAEHQIFKGYAVALFNSKTQAHGIDYVLKEIRYQGNQIDKDKLEKRYDKFNTCYRELVKQNLKENPDLTGLSSNAKLILGAMEQGAKIKWDAAIRDKIPELMAHIFALWTLQNSQHYWNAGGVADKDAYLLQPHPAQVISIFRMLGVDDSKPLIHNLVQIGTGEGKSVTLAITSCVLALAGFDVSCASYSEYLSHRDYQGSEKLFTALGLCDHIHYGTFNKLCERIINEGGDVRRCVENLILSDSKKDDGAKNNATRTLRAKILLIDEVDVFFNKDFYGNCYSPSATLRHEKITHLIDFIWKDRATPKKLRDIQQTNEYKACCEVVKGWEFLLDEAIKDMLIDLKTFASHDYQVSADKIGYKEQDGISYNVRYGYKTLFAYYHEHEQGRISEKSLKDNIAISLQCGKFSYAEVPKKFACIMGVSGTLETLSKPEREVVENDYKILKHTYMPSLFGKNNLIFAKKTDIKIVESSDYFITLKSEIDDRLIGINPATKRAVLVFFQDKKSLMGFYESSNFLPIKDNALIMTEENTLQEKEMLIKRATTAGQIALFTKSFGRGTDFICRDQVVAANGGAHVIQTFLSEELSEEVQIRGRTARQGSAGSFSMVLCQSALERFLITKEEIADARQKGDFYPLLDEKRTRFFRTQYAESKKYVDYAAEEHKSGEILIEALKNSNIAAIKEQLGERNQGAEEEKCSRTIVLMDATASMGHLLQKAKNAVSTMFSRISTVLKHNGRPANSFQMQFVVYRNYNAPKELLLQSSVWATKPEELKVFMNTVKADHGWGEEAVEIGFSYVNKEAQEPDGVSQVILIGDAPANTDKAMVLEKRKHNGENYWVKTKYATPTDYQTEYQHLKARNIPVHAFYVNAWAKTNFTEIATQTGGRCEELDVNSTKGSDQLTDLVSEEVLRKTGRGQEEADKLVEAYKKMFSKSYA